MTINLPASALRVEVVTSRTRRRTASLRYNPGGHFTLAVPQGYDQAWAEEFLVSRRKWMERVREKARVHRESRQIVPGTRIDTEYYSLCAEEDTNLQYPQYRVVRSKTEPVATFHLAPGFFTPENSDKLYANLEKYLLAQLMKLASTALIDRAEYLARLHGIRVKEFFVRVQKSRLGYCTHDDRIMLNGRLLFAPQKIRDYVICHELAHTRHKNHSKVYWDFLERLFPGAQKTDKLLRDSSVYSMRTAL